MKKLILIPLLGLLALTMIFAAEEPPVVAEKTSATSSADMVLNLNSIKTRVNAGFASAPDAVSNMTLASVNHQINLIDIPVTDTADHVTLPESVVFYIWYYVSTSSSNLTFKLNIGPLSNGAQTNPHLIGYKISTEPVETAGQKIGSLTPTNFTYKFKHDEPSTMSSQEHTFYSGQVASLNKGYLECTVSEFNYDSSKITNSQYKSVITLTIAAN